jgi:hypothetical protein
MRMVSCAIVPECTRMTPFLQQLYHDRFGSLPFKWIGPSHDS